MRVIALGGCGLMGRHFVATAIKLNAFSRLTIADRNLTAAKAYAGSLAHPLIDAVQIDATNLVELTSLLKNYDVVISTIGPYYLLGTGVLGCAIDARCNYIDICDDPEPTIAMLAMHRQAVAAGITALVGFGASPGISNLLAVKAINAIGRAERVVTTWGSSSAANENETADAEMGIAVDHWVEQLTGTIPVHQDGRIQHVRPLKTVDLFVPSIGRRTAYTVGHPEPLTLPITFPFICDSVNAMVFSRPLIQTLKLIQRKVDSGEQSVPQAAEFLRMMIKNVNGVQLSMMESALLIKSSILERVWSHGYMPVELSAIAEIRQGSKRLVASAWLNGHIPGGMGPNTCIPTAVTLSMLCDGLIPQRGVFAPEAVIVPDIFFNRLARFVQVQNAEEPPVVVKTALT